jgi:hypothetical protein
MTRRALLVVAGLVVLATVVATGGVSSVTADRPLSVAVVADDRAYLGYDPGQVDNGTWTPRVTNNFEVTLTVTVRVDGDSASTTLAPGEGATLVLEGVACGDAASITAVGRSVRVEMDRPVQCG